jgi:CoA:oxalate CoA-transferase
MGRTHMTLNENLPLAGITVLDFSQFLAGPVAAMKLADLGARVIKVERPDGGDFARRIALGETYLGGDSISFHSFNRGKLGVTLDLKAAKDVEIAKTLIAGADVMIQNFRPGVIERIGLDYSSVKAINPSLIYGSISGYGSVEAWVTRPGQDLLAQSISGLTWYQGSNQDPPQAIGIALADTLAANHMVQGILALLIRRQRLGRGGLVETSLIEVLADLQFEVFTAMMHDPTLGVERGGTNSAHPLLAAPYGIYETSDGYLSLAMADIPQLSRLLEVPDLMSFTEAADWLDRRDEINGLVAGALRGRASEAWLEVLDGADIWCAPVLTPEQFLTHEGFAELHMVGTTTGSPDRQMRYLKSPLRVDGERLGGDMPAPRLGEHTQSVVDAMSAGAME